LQAGREEDVNPDNHCSSHVVVARALYLASEELQEIVGCFFDFHDIRESPK